MCLVDMDMSKEIESNCCTHTGIPTLANAQSSIAPRTLPSLPPPNQMCGITLEK